MYKLVICNDFCCEIAVILASIDQGALSRWGVACGLYRGGGAAGASEIGVAISPDQASMTRLQRAMRHRVQVIAK